MQPNTPIQPVPSTPQGAESLVVRTHQRVRCTLAGHAEIATEHASLIVLSTNAVDSAGALPGSIVDVSRGGFAFRTKVYLPKQARLVITITDPLAADEEFRPARSAQVKVMRVVMVDRAPTYELGTAFVGASPAQIEATSRLIAHIIAAQGGAAPSAGSVGGGKAVA